MTVGEWWVKQDLYDNTTDLHTNTFYRPDPVWPIIPLTFITLVTINMWGVNFTHIYKEVVFFMLQNIAVLYCTILKILLICYTILFLRYPVHTSWRNFIKEIGVGTIYSPCIIIGWNDGSGGSSSNDHDDNWWRWR